jgi:TonB-dependent SusC/RagA subfamily outer membrane receptor
MFVMDSIILTKCRHPSIEIMNNSITPNQNRNIMKGILIQGVVFSILVMMPEVSILGQERILQGKVTVFDSIDVINAGIEVKSTREVFYSDTLGEFSISCQAKDKIKVMARGFSTKNVKIKEGTKSLHVNMKLKPGPSYLDQAVESGHVRDRDKLASLTSADRNTVDYSHFTSIYEAITSSFPGVQVTPGNQIVLQGVSGSLTSNAALLVVDGRVVNESTFGSINPGDIARIDLIKDGSASMYGMRGANGVVVVETKAADSE